MFDLGKMADLAVARGLGVVHATVIPRYPEANRDADNTLTDQLNGRIRDLAGRSLRRLADPNEVFRNTTGLFTGFYSTVKPDPVGHPNAAGYELLARVFSDVILGLDNVSPVPGVVDPAPGARNVRSDIPISVDVWDFGTGIDIANTFLLVNGLPVTATPVGDSRRVHLTYESLAPLTGTVIIGLRSRDLATPPNTIDRTISSFTVRGGTSVLQGDLNLDNRVDGTDLVRLGRSFGSVIGDAAYDANADFNADGKIDGQDLAVLASNFGRTSTGS
jgi:Dockerin type I domain